LPEGAGPIEPGDVDPTRRNLCDPYGDSQLTPSHKTAGVFAGFRHEFGSDLTLSAEAMAGHRATNSESAYHMALLEVPHTNAFRQAYGFNDILPTRPIYVDYLWD